MIDHEAHRAQVESWRSARYASLRRDVGWLTLAGLAWLKPGLNRVGSGPGADVQLPRGPAEAGTLTVDGSGVVATGAWRHDGRPVEGLGLVSDADGEPTILELEGLRSCIIERGGRLALRTWDLDAERRRSFAGVPHWPVDPAWRLEAVLHPTPGRTIRVPDVLGMAEERPSPADVVLEIGGTPARLQALDGGSQGGLWLIFGDATNGADSYGGGRFLFTVPPTPDGRVVVDFNQAYNPPCAFSPWATCPLAWPENRLPLRVEAGERRYR